MGIRDRLAVLGQRRVSRRRGAVIDFSFGVVGVHRLEARSIASNGRGNAALRKVGALQEGILRRSFQRNGRYFDQILWSILKDDWREAKGLWGQKLH